MIYPNKKRLRNFLSQSLHFLLKVLINSLQNSVVDQIVDLVTQDVAGVHLYTMNNEDVAYHVYQATKALFDHQPNFEVN